MAKKTVRASELTQDPANPNRGTERGAALLRESVDTCGFGRSIVLDRHGVIIAGNKTAKAADAQGAAVEVVETDGHALVVVQRTDLDLMTDKKARQLAYYDNRVQEVDLAWDATQIRQDLLAGVDLSQGFFPDELSSMAVQPVEPVTDGGIESIAESIHEATEVHHKPTIGPTEVPGFGDQDVRSTFVLAFHTVDQQSRWEALMRKLAVRYPDVASSGGRLARYLEERV